GWLFHGRRGASDRLIPRWLFVRGLGSIYFSALFSLIFQIRGLIGAAGILPAGSDLQAVAQSLGHWQRLWYAPTLLWFSSGAAMLHAVCWAGMIASLLLVLNLWPRATLAVCFVCFLSFVSAAQDFSGYQSDGMLLEAGFICFLIFTPWQLGVILTANYTFLNYLVLALGVLLLDDSFALRVLPAKWRGKLDVALADAKSGNISGNITDTERSFSNIRSHWNA